jgi:mono/diheme cytochrome c family protein
MIRLRADVNALISTGRVPFLTLVSLCAVFTILLLHAGAMRAVVAAPGPTAPAPTNSAAAKPPASSWADQMQAARKLFWNSCAKCHEEDGQGRQKAGSEAAIPDFTDRRWQQKRSDAELQVIILDGMGAGMPAFHNKISVPQARTLVGFIRAVGSMPKSQADDFPRRFDEFVRKSESMPQRPAGNSPDDFSRRWDELQKELDDLRKQYRELTVPERKR